VRTVAALLVANAGHVGNLVNDKISAFALALANLLVLGRRRGVANLDRQLTLAQVVNINIKLYGINGRRCRSTVVSRRKLLHEVPGSRIDVIFKNRLEANGVLLEARVAEEAVTRERQLRRDTARCTRNIHVNRHLLRGLHDCFLKDYLFNNTYKVDMIKIFQFFMIY